MFKNGKIECTTCGKPFTDLQDALIHEKGCKMDIEQAFKNLKTAIVVASKIVGEPETDLQISLAISLDVCIREVRDALSEIHTDKVCMERTK